MRTWEALEDARRGIWGIEAREFEARDGGAVESVEAPTGACEGYEGEGLVGEKGGKVFRGTRVVSSRELMTFAAVRRDSALGIGGD